MKISGYFLQEKSSFKILGLTFSSRLDWGSYIVSVAKTASKKIAALIHTIKFLSLEVALYLYKSTIWLCREYCCHVWTGAPSCYLEFLDKLQKRICRHSSTPRPPRRPHRFIKRGLTSSILAVRVGMKYFF